MKSTDWAAIVLVTVFSLVFAFVVGGKFLSNDEDKSAQVEEVIEIKSNFGTPSTAIFNEQSINLTQIVEVSESDSTQPFSN